MGRWVGMMCIALSGAWLPVADGWMPSAAARVEARAGEDARARENAMARLDAPVREDARADELMEFVDAERDRVVPVRVYLPASREPAAVILVSHGLGGTRNAMSFLGKHWSEAGFAVVAMQHVGSDDSVWRDVPLRERMAAMRRAASGENLMRRVGDVRFVLDELARRNEDDAVLKGRLDLERVGMAGHSFGAGTTQAVSGIRYGTRARTLRYREERIDAAIAFSPSVPERATDLDWTFGAMDLPMFHFTGTRDEAPIGGQSPESRVKPFEHGAGNPRYLLVFDGGDHSVYGGGEGRVVRDERYPAWHEQLCVLTTLFWKAHLLGDESSRDGLAPERVRPLVNAKDRYETAED